MLNPENVRPPVEDFFFFFLSLVLDNVLLLKDNFIFGMRTDVKTSSEYKINIIQ